MKKMKQAGLLVLLLVVADCVRSNSATNNNDFLNSFAVEVDGGLVEAQAVASDLGFLVHREVSVPCGF